MKFTDTPTLWQTAGSESNMAGVIKSAFFALKQLVLYIFMVAEFLLSLNKKGGIGNV